MNQPLIIDALRTPRGRGSDKGALKGVKPVELLAQPLRALAERHAFDTAQVIDGLFGCVTQTGDQGANLGKLALLQAGWSDAVAGMTLNRYCASGLSAVQFAGWQALQGDGLAVGGGVEMMSRVPMASDQGPLTHDRDFQRDNVLVPIGLAADAVATMEGFSRSQCDDYALASQQRAAAALAGGHYRSVVPVQAGAEVLLTQDETPRPQTSADTLSGLAPAFAVMGEKYGFDALLCQRYGLSKMDHVHHAGNSPAMADGASAVLVASPNAAQRMGLKARARILSSADCCVDRTLALTGAFDATCLALKRAGLTPADIDLFEVNESFAGLMLHYQKHLAIGHDRLNVNGGAIALGHAMGSTGASLVGMALDELERRDQRRAVIAICGAAGLAVAMVIERVTAA